MALLEKEVIRFAESLDDFDHMSLKDVGGWGPHGYWLVVRDHRFALGCEMSSHCDYWDFIAALMAPPLRDLEGGGLAGGATTPRDILA